MSAEPALGRAGLGSGGPASASGVAAPTSNISAGLMALTGEQSRQRSPRCGQRHYHRAAPAKTGGPLERRRRALGRPPGSWERGHGCSTPHHP